MQRNPNIIDWAVGRIDLIKKGLRRKQLMQAIDEPYLLEGLT